MRDPRIDTLVKNAAGHTITDEEVAWAADWLQHGAIGDDRWSLHQTVGWSGRTQYEDLVASFLECPDDPWMSRIAVQILCNWFGLTAKYVEVLRRFLGGVPWDVDADVRQVAIRYAGDYLHSHQDANLLRRLWEIAHGRGPRLAVTVEDIEAFGAEGADERATFIQAQEAEVAIESLSKLLGDSSREVNLGRQSQTRKDWEAEVLRRVEERFGPLL